VLCKTHDPDREQRLLKIIRKNPGTDRDFFDSQSSETDKAVKQRHRPITATTLRKAKSVLVQQGAIF
jgi:hypothetical protein